MSEVTHRIGVVSDTHDRFHPKLSHWLKGVDEIWHLGDVCEQRILDSLKEICPKLIAVRGNNDFELAHIPHTRRLERGGEIFNLIHIPPESPPEEKGWLLFGHTHIPQDELIKGVRWFNPGSAGKDNKAPMSFAFLTKKGTAPYQVEQVRL